MMVQVRNLNTHVFKQQFMDRMIVIPPGESIEMDFDEANKFVGTYSSPKLDGDGNHMPEGFKMLRIEDAVAKPVAAPEVKIDPNKCLSCGYTASGQTDLNEHLKTHGEALVDPVAEEQIKRKPGRPAKDK